MNYHTSTDQDELSQAAAGIHVEMLVDPTVNYASYQNNVPLIRSLTLTNGTDEPLRDIQIVVRCEPAFADVMRLRFERLDAQETRRLDALDLKFQHRYLSDLT